MPTRVRAISVHMGALHTHLRAVHIVLVPVPFTAHTASSHVSSAMRATIARVESV